MITAEHDLARGLMDTFKRLNRVIHMNMFKSFEPRQKMTPLFVMIRLKKANLQGGMRVSEIASSIGITVPAVTQILTSLEKSGLVHRAMDPDDRRAVRVVLTPEGEAMLDPALKSYDDSFAALIEYLGKADSEKLFELLTKVERFFVDRGGAHAMSHCDADNS